MHCEVLLAAAIRNVHNDNHVHNDSVHNDNQCNPERAVVMTLCNIWSQRQHAKRLPGASCPSICFANAASTFWRERAPSADGTKAFLGECSAMSSFSLLGPSASSASPFPRGASGRLAKWDGGEG